MKRLIGTVLTVLMLSGPVFAETAQEPESVASKMVTKFTRGFTNVVTAVLEVPKQTTVLTAEHGGFGLLIGPLAGVVMTVYRAALGTSEMVLFMVPAPGYYDPAIDPEFVWDNWVEKTTYKDKNKETSDNPQSDSESEASKNTEEADKSK